MTTKAPDMPPRGTWLGGRIWSPRRGAALIAILYAAGAGAWIMLSGSVLGMLPVAAERLLHLEMLKGALFVAVTAAILYAVLARIFRQVTTLESVASEREEAKRDILDLLPLPVFVNDGNGKFREVNRAALRILGTTKEAVLGRAPSDLVVRKDADPIKRSLDRALSGAEQRLTCKVTTAEGERNFEILAHHRTTERSSERSAGVIAVCVDITDRLRAKALSEARFSGYREVMSETASSIASLLEARDPFTAGHQKRVGRIAIDIAEQLAIAPFEREGLILSATLHDIGKIGIPIELLIKPGRLTPSEMEVIRGHVRISHDVLRQVDFPWPVAETIFHHHERLDGSGYPQGLAGDQIPLLSRILIVADVADAMTSHRPYRPALPVRTAIEELTINSGKLYDPDVVKACVATLGKPDFANA